MYIHMLYIYRIQRLVPPPHAATPACPAPRTYIRIYICIYI